MDGFHGYAIESEQLTSESWRLVVLLDGDLNPASYLINIAKRVRLNRLGVLY